MPPLSLERRRRRNRRLTLLALGLAITIGLFVALGLFMRSRSDSAERQRVVDSVVAYEQEDYERVVELLEDTGTNTHTIRLTAGDPAAMWRYVVARREVEMQNNEHYALLFPALRQVVALDPGNLEAGRMLLELLMGLERNTEAIETASRLITAHPDEVDLLRVRYALNQRLNRDEESLDDALAAAEAEPLDVRTQMDVASLMQKLNRDPSEFHERAEALHEAHPEDPRAEFILARAWLLEGHLFEAQQLLESASQREAPSKDFIRVMVESLDSLGRYEESFAYLKRNVEPGLTGPLMYEVFFRDFEADHHQATVDRAATLELTEAYPNVIALAAISHHRLGDTDQAQRHLAELKSREDDPLAQHWAACLGAMWQVPPDPGAFVAVCVAACEDNPYHAYLHYLLAEAYRAVGEHEAALAEMKVTHDYRPSWGHPYFLDAEMLLALDRPEEALAAATAALRRRPVLPYATVLGVAQARAADPNDQLQVNRALTFIDSKVHAQQPNEPRTFAAAVDLLARAGQPERAIDRIRTGVALETPLPQDTLLDLAATSRSYGLNMASAILERAREAYGADPRVVLQQALARAQTQSPEAGLAYLRSATPEPATLAWRVAEAEILETLNDPTAQATWVRLADDFPSDLEVQRIALSAVGVRVDRDFADRVIDRIKSISGTESIGWKIERARYHLGADDPARGARQAEELLNEVIATAPNRVEPYRLLAYCQTLRGDETGATRSIEQAANLRPGDMRIQFQLGQMLHNQRQYIAARQPLMRIAQNERADPALRFNATTLLARQDEVEKLLPVLEAMRQQYNLPDAQLILLADLYTATGQTGQADAVCEQMLQQPSPQSIAYTAEYYWRTGRVDQSKHVIELVNDVEMPADVRSTVLGQHAARLGETDLALNHFRSAAQAAPEQAGRWEYLVVQALVLGRPGVAVSDAQQALAHHTDNAGLRTIADNAALVETTAGDVRFRPIAATLVNDADHRLAGLRALRLVADASKNGGSATALARELASLADQHTDYLPLQNLSATLLSEVRLFEPAAEIASRAMESFPADGTSARLAAVALAETSQWRRTLSVSQSWGRRSPSQRPLADVYLAAAQRNLGRIDEALETLKPYLDAALADPDNHQSLLGEYTTALVQRGRVDQAWGVLQPNLSGGVAWRELAMRLAGATLPTTDAASRWFDGIQSTIPADSPQEHLYFAQSLFAAGDRLNAAGLIERAREQIDQATQRADAPVSAWFLRGRISDRGGDLAAAEESYREALRQQPDFTLAMNNLAMILAMRGRNLDEAIDLARRASASVPNDPNMQDTLARVFSRAGRHEEALSTIERAIQTDRQNPAWIRSKADLLDAAGRNEEAHQLRERHGLVTDSE